MAVLLQMSLSRKRIFEGFSVVYANDSFPFLKSDASCTLGTRQKYTFRNQNGHLCLYVMLPSMQVGGRSPSF